MLHVLLLRKFWGFLLCFCAVLFWLCTYHPLQNTRSVPYTESAAPHSGIGIYVINLDHSTDRWAYVSGPLHALNLPLHRIAGVHGAKLPQDFLASSVDNATTQHFFLGKTMGKGSVGCYLSHIKAWKAFLASPYAYGLICEDDIGFAPKALREALDEVVDKAALWDICAFSLLKNRKGGPLTLAHLPSGRRLCIYTRTILSAGCYLLNRCAARRLLQKALPIKVPLDHFYTYDWDLSVTFAGVEPRIVNQDYGRGNSEINRIEREHQAPIGWGSVFHKWLFSLRVGTTRLLHVVYRYLLYGVFHIPPGQCHKKPL